MSDTNSSATHRSLRSLARGGALILVALAACGPASGTEPTGRERTCVESWIERSWGQPPTVASAESARVPRLTVLQRSHQCLAGRSVWGTPLKLGERVFARGLYMDAPARVHVALGQPAVELSAEVGIDNNADTERNPDAGSARFHVAVGGERVFSTGVCRLADGAVAVRVPLKGADELTLEVDDGGDGRGWDQCVWGDVKVVLLDGTELWLDGLPQGGWPVNRSSLPFSFRYGGIDSAECLPAWARRESENITPDRVERVLSYTDQATGMVVECEITHYPQSAAVEWVCWLHNRGETPSPLIEDWMPLDSRLFSGQEGGPVTIRWSQGDACTAESFLPHDEPLAPDGTRRFTGHSSDTHYLPFFNVTRGDEGWILAVGWTGRWVAEFARDGTSDVRLRAGMPETRFRLQPGERVRGPRIGLLRYDGPMIRGHNLFRRFMREHIVPRHDGEPIVPPVAINNVAALWLRAQRTQQRLGALTEQSELALIDKAARLGCEAYWMDAYWFPQPWWEGNMGNWWPREDDFPRGLRPLSDAAHRNSMKFVLWFAPLHVHDGTRWGREYPQFIDSTNNGGTSSVGAGIWKLYDAAAREFLVDWLSHRVSEWGVDVYREDFGTPLPPDEGAERIGVAEMKQIEGFYQFWSELLRRNPGLTIDNCSGGGRRIDFETARLAYTLWRSDFNDVGEGLKDRAHWPMMGRADQVMVTGLSLYFPLHTGPVWDMCPYNVRSAMTAGAVIYSEVDDERFPAELARQAIDEIKELRPFFAGDIYPLAELTTDQSHWYAYQLDRPDRGDGIVLVFRRPESPDRVQAFTLRNIDPDAVYRISVTGETYETGEWQEVSGHELRDLSVSIDAVPGSTLVRYRRITVTDAKDALP